MIGPRIRQGIRVLCATAAIALPCAAWPGSGAAETMLTPTQLVRSFQRVQDRVVAGDVPAVDMLKALHRKVGADLMAAKTADVSRRDLESILIFVVSGGNPAIIGAYEGAFEQEPELADLAARLYRYRGGNSSDVLEGFDVSSIDGQLAASIRLIRGIAGDDPARQIEDLDAARIAVPGTIIEEAALRRLMVIYRQQNDAPKFARTAGRYARNFGASPYARQFSDEMVQGAFLMDDAGYGEDVASIMAYLPPEKSRALAARIRRAASVMGRSDFFAALAADPDDPVNPVAQETNPPAEIAVETPSQADQTVLEAYNRIGSMTNAQARAVHDRLVAIDPAELLAENRRLRDLSILALAAISGGASAVPEPAEKTMADEVPIDEMAVVGRDADEGDGEFKALVGEYRKSLEASRSLLETVE